MKILKKLLVTIMILTVVFVITNANAYTGGVVDAGDEIDISAVLNNGNAAVNTSTSISNGKMYYQFVEMSKEKYDQIRKMKDELNVVDYFNKYEANETDDNYDNYISARKYYKDTYGVELTNLSPDHMDELRDQIIGNLPDYTNDWTLTSNNTISIDLTSFSGTKYYTAWVKVESGERTVYEAQIYDITGTKTDSNNSENTNTDNNTVTNSGVIDAGDEIGMPTILTNGIGKVTLANNITNYQMYYQVNEIENSKYKEIRKLKDELIVVENFNLYEANETEDNYDNYISARKYYKDTYGVELTDLSPDHMEELRAQIKGLLPKYTENWIQTTNDTFDTNLSSFSGNKDFVVWVKVISGDRTIYDGDIYELTGTKQETTETPTTPDKDDDNKQETPTTPDKDDDNKQETPTTPDKDDDNKQETPTTPDKDDDNKQEIPTTPDKDDDNKQETPTTPDKDDDNKQETPTTPDKDDDNKQETPTTPDKDDDNKQETPTTSDKNDDKSNKEENKQEQINKDNSDKKGQSTTTTSSSNKGTTTTGSTTTSSKELPYTGKSDIIIISAIIITLGASITTFIKFKKIK